MLKFQGKALEKPETEYITSTFFRKNEKGTRRSCQLIQEKEKIIQNLKVKMIPNISAILINVSGPICQEISERIKSSTTNYKK